MTKKIELAVTALSQSESQPGFYTLVLEDFERQSRIPVTIGPEEAQAIAISMEKMQPMRPLTHDLFKNTLDALQVRLKEVFIRELKDDVFYSSLILVNAENQVIEVDARTSDAIAMAVRFDAPIFASADLLEEAGVWIAAMQVRQKKGSMAEHSIEELEQLLQRLVEKEDYESAVRIRNYLNMRRQKGE